MTIGVEKKRDIITSGVEKKRKNLDELLVQLLSRLELDNPTASNNNHAPTPSIVTGQAIHYTTPSSGPLYYPHVSSPGQLHTTAPYHLKRDIITSGVEKKRKNLDELLVQLLSRLELDNPTASNNNHAPTPSIVTGQAIHYTTPSSGPLYYPHVSSPGQLHTTAPYHLVQFGSTTATIGSVGPTVTPGQEITLSHAFTSGTLHDPATDSWNMDTYGTLSRYKARLVANGSTQLEGVDVDKTFNPVVKPGDQYCLLVIAHMDTCNLSRTPIDIESKLGSDGDLVCLYMHDPREPYFSALKRILRYVRGTLDYGLQLYFLLLQIWVLIQMLIRLVALLLRDRPHVIVFFATTYSFGPLSVNRCFLVPMLRLSIMVLPMLLLRLDQCTKHIKIDIHFVCDLVAVGQVRVLHVPSRYQFADIFSKANGAVFLGRKIQLSLRAVPAVPDISKGHQAYKGVAQ
nr:hypothetical protein [Tanacetum cinerariifolium]